VNDAMDDTTAIRDHDDGPRIERVLSTDVWWYAQRRVWRFPYRDPATRARKFMNCTPARFVAAGIHLPDPQIVRKPTKTAENLARELQRRLLAALPSVAITPIAPSPPRLSEAIERFHAMYDDRDAGYAKTLRAICAEFLDTVGDKPVERVTDEDLKAYERRIAKRLCRASVRSYLRQLAMLIEFCVRKGWIREDPRLTYRVPREELRDPNPFNDEELRRFFEICRSPIPGHPRGWHHLEWIGTGLLCLGLRSVELQHARWEDVNFDERFLFVARSHGAKERQARQLQPIPLAAMPVFEARRKASGIIWTGYFGETASDGVLSRARESIQKHHPEFQWKRFRKTFATIIAQAGNDDMMVNRLMRHSAGGKTTSIAQRHYVGKSLVHLRTAVDEAFAPYGDLLRPDASVVGAAPPANAAG
jgi:integrase